MEDYLETIHLLEGRQRTVRIRDIAQELAITMPSVTGAMKSLVRQALVTHSLYNYVELTSKGRRIAREVFNRHKVIRDFLIRILDIDPKTAERDACGMEHTISNITLQRLVQFMEIRTRYSKGTGSGHE